MAHACNLAIRRLGCLDGLRSGFQGAVVLCRSGVRAKFGVNMGSMEKSVLFRLVKEEHTGPGWKHSRQKLPRQTVVGLHLWVGGRSQPDQDSRTPPWLLFSSTGEEICMNLLLQWGVKQRDSRYMQYPFWTLLNLNLKRKKSEIKLFTQFVSQALWRTPVIWARRG